MGKCQCVQQAHVTACVSVHAPTIGFQLKSEDIYGHICYCVVYNSIDWEGWGTLFGGRESPVLSVADGCIKVETRYDNRPVNFHEPNT